MVSIVDVLDDGLSSVYTYFDPDRTRQPVSAPTTSSGRSSLARQLGLDYLYLGYWIKDSPKMAYKERFRPLEGRINGIWQLLGDDVLG
jgi:arginyl-tRNA--protein-N-Asp/Glu arginylyltransferase